MPSLWLLGRAMLALVVLALSTVALVLVPPGAGVVRAQAEVIELDVPRVVLRGVPFTLTRRIRPAQSPRGAAHAPRGREHI